MTKCNYLLHNLDIYYMFCPQSWIQYLIHLLLVDLLHFFSDTVLIYVEQETFWCFTRSVQKCMRCVQLFIIIRNPGSTVI